MRLVPSRLEFSEEERGLLHDLLRERYGFSDQELLAVEMNRYEYRNDYGEHAVTFIRHRNDASAYVLHYQVIVDYFVSRGLFKGKLYFLNKEASDECNEAGREL